MIKRILKSFAIILILFVGFSFYMSPRLGGLLNFGKDSIDKTIHKLEFDTISDAKYNLVYKDFSQREDLVILRKEFKLDSIIADCETDFDKVVKIQSWVQSRWKHDGENMPEKNDALFILREAEKGKRFRCVEYSIVANQCLLSLGFTVRGLGLMTKDISEVKSGGGHAVNEVFVRDLNKWVLIDPQYDVITTFNNKPLNAVELQRCIANNWDFEILNPNQIITKEDYKKWIGPYLYYFTTTLKGEPVDIWDRIVGNKKQLTLIPKGAKEPKYFQKIFRINNSYYTNSINDFYPKLDD
ncbi:transglutaminase-like domain-containing protein [Riemerella anatipestifer]|uniref:transglutaminase-like domain-containing protein n=1 Tax=Riemerella anatipestifer TaxID=34085 RepID=UPI0030BCE9E2